ncbi:hypothetical protein GCM10009661_46790 [Catellatospora chokoriensis]|uniref:Uncharacterized protein n=1 Tax=Catellatospora chokoriensis TaxID=310353 RepID=A0A8J3K7R9_9ACTN|nr:hypothetical protein Cch02nite_57240 [Catellatospora chokoriensis]
MAIVRRMSELSLNAEPGDWRGRVILPAARTAEAAHAGRGKPKCPMDPEKSWQIAGAESVPATCSGEGGLSGPVIQPTYRFPPDRARSRVPPARPNPVTFGRSAASLSRPSTSGVRHADGDAADPPAARLAGTCDARSAKHEREEL